MALESIDSCPISLELNRTEQEVMTRFRISMSHLDGVYGSRNFLKKLNSVIERTWPENSVLEVSPTFMEKTLNIVNQQHLRDAIAYTVGIDNKRWTQFDMIMKDVTVSEGLVNGRMGLDYHKITELLIEDIKKASVKSMQARGLSAREADIYKARAVTQLTNMYLYLIRWDALNREIIDRRAAGYAASLPFIALSGAAAAGFIAGMIYAGPVVAAAGVIGGKFATDIIVATQLVRIGQILGGVAVGGVGAPVGKLFLDSRAYMMTANRLSQNNGTVYACEIAKQFEEWRAQGIRPYMKASIQGGAMALGGGVLTLSAVGAKSVLLATSIGVGVAQAFTTGKITEAAMASLAEYRLAEEAHARGDRTAALEHLHRAREFAQTGNEAILEFIMIGALTSCIAGNFIPAFQKGGELIRVLFANSSDTLPQAVNITLEALKAARARLATLVQSS